MKLISVSYKNSRDKFNVKEAIDKYDGVYVGDI